MRALDSDKVGKHQNSEIMSEEMKMQSEALSTKSRKRVML